MTNWSQGQAESAIELTDKLAEALAYAIPNHREPRKCTRIPYVAHLLEVCALVLEDEGSEKEAIAALLHDVAEDAGGAWKLSEISERFGPEVARIVEGCSDSLVDIAREAKPGWWQRKREYIARLPDESPDVLRVSLADKVANARAILRDYRELGEQLWPRFNPESDQPWYYRSLLEVYRSRLNSRFVDELERSVVELEQLCRPRRRPIAVSYRVMPKQLYAGEYPGSLDEHEAQQKVRALIEAGVTVFYDLTEEGEGLRPYAHLLEDSVRHVRRPIRDGGIASDVAMRAALDELEALLHAGETVYVHCWGGHGRTGTLIACHLIEEGAPPEEALYRLSAYRRGMEDEERASPETTEQIEFVKRWAATQESISVRTS